MQSKKCLKGHMKNGRQGDLNTVIMNSIFELA